MTARIIPFPGEWHEEYTCPYCGQTKCATVSAAKSHMTRCRKKHAGKEGDGNGTAVRTP